MTAGSQAPAQPIVTVSESRTNKVRKKHSFGVSTLISVLSQHSGTRGRFTAQEHGQMPTEGDQVTYSQDKQKRNLPQTQSAPPILPLSRTSDWLASRSSFARWSRADCSSNTLVCRDLYKFILELERHARTIGSRQQRRDRRPPKQREKIHDAPHMILDL